MKSRQITAAVQSQNTGQSTKCFKACMVHHSLQQIINNKMQIPVLQRVFVLQVHHAGLQLKEIQSLLKENRNKLCV